MDFEDVVQKIDEINHDETQKNLVTAASLCALKEGNQVKQGEVLENVNTSKQSAYATMKKLLINNVIRVYNNICYIYNGRYYKPLDDNDLKRLIMESCREEIQKNGNSGFVKDVGAFVLIEPSLLITDNRRSNEIIAFENGVLNIKNRMFYPHSEHYFVLYAINGLYLNDVCPNTPYFDTYLYKVTGGDNELICRI